MPLNPTTLAAALKPGMKSAYIACGAADNAALETLMTALSTVIASAVVTHITSNALVAGTATGALGGGPGVPVVGTIT